MVTFYRRLPKFDYICPGSIEEALDLLSNYENGKCRLYAGGTDVIPKLKRRIVDKPEILVDLKGIPELDYVEYDDQHGLRIGALATIHSTATSPIVMERYPMLSQAAGSIASEESRPIDDHRASAEYRKIMVEVLVKRAIHQTLSNR